MNPPTNRAEARTLLRQTLADAPPERHLSEDDEDAIADMMIEQIDTAKRDGAYEVESKTLDPVFQLLTSAKTRLRSMQSFLHVQRFNPEMLAGSNRAPMLDQLVIDAIEDLAKAEAKDDRIPF